MSALMPSPARGTHVSWPSQQGSLGENEQDSMAGVGEPAPDGGDSVERAVEMDVNSGLTRIFEVMGPPSSLPLQKSFPPSSSHLRNSSMSASDSCLKSSSKCKNSGLENSFSTTSHKRNHSGPANLVTQSSKSFATISNSSIALRKRGSWAPSGTIALNKIGDNLEGLNNIFSTQDSKWPQSHSQLTSQAIALI